MASLIDGCSLIIFLLLFSSQKMWAAILFRTYGKHPVSSRNMGKEKEESAHKPGV
jgi:hypothetical protein